MMSALSGRRQSRQQSFCDAHRMTLRSILLIGAATATVSFAQTHVVQPSDVANLKTIANPKISPDGRLVAYSLHTPTASGKPRDEHIWIAQTETAGTMRPFIYSEGTDSSPAWSPDGRHLAFLSDRKNPLAENTSPFIFKVVTDVQKSTQTAPAEQKDMQPAPPAAPDTTSDAEAKDMQIWWISIDGGEAEPLTNLPGGIRSFRWSHDGRHIAFLRTDPDSKAEAERKKAKNDEHVIDHDYHFARMWSYDVTAHTATLLTKADQNIDTLDWSPDDSAIVCRVSPTPRLDDYWRVSKVIIFDAHTGTQKQVIEENSGYQEPTYSYDGLQLAYSRFTQKRTTDVHFVRTLSTSRDVMLEEKLKGTIAEMLWMPDGHLFVNAYVGAHTEANIIDASTLKAKPLQNLPLTSLDFDVSHDGKTFIFLGETPAQPLEVSKWSSGTAQVLTATNPQVSGWSLGTEKEVQWQNPTDHHTVYGVLSLPPGFKTGQRYKTVIHLHGGPEEAFTVGFNANWYNYAALLASQGYVVLQPNYRGSAGQEIAYTEGNYRDWGGRDFQDMMAGVDWLQGQHIADADRMAIAGWSYGGFMTSWAVTHTNHFKAAMAGAAVTDVFSMSTTTDIAPSYVSSYMGAPDAAEYDRHSAVRFAADCHTPVLVLHGEADVRVPLSQGQELYHALKFLGRDTEMVTYPREPHIFSEREHQVDSLTRELAWFDKYLSKAPAP